MIHVLCLNPAIDKLYVIDGFAAGEDYPGQRPTVRFGGKGVNVARVLSQLGALVHLYAFMGEQSEAGFRLEMEKRCACTFVTVPGACRTTVNIIDRQNDRETVITEAGPQVRAAHVQALLAALEENVRAGDMVCCSGSIIAGAPADIYAQVSRLCGEKGARCALDCNAAALPQSLADARYALGKPNERELCALLGEERTQAPERIAALGRRLMPPYGALLVSMGAQGGVWIENGQAYLARVPDLPIVSTVGSGDAALAGALHAMNCGYAPQEALRLAMACGVANAMLGEVGCVRAEDVKEAVRQINVAQLSKEECL
ncbi:MAG: 1-phosphofructokinase family hexose kinase [Clostridia bacterium]|nr:1-phosphofructokinase family hexose kinase [Clostridia bacterium]